MSIGNSGVGITGVAQGRITQMQLMERSRAEIRSRNSANWFIWIAGLSLINSVLALLHANVTLLLGLATTQMIDAVGVDSGGAVGIIAATMDVIAIGLFAALGVVARAHQQWAFMLGLILYILDAVLLAGLFGLAWQAGLTSTDITSFAVGGAIHAYAIFRLSQGLAENRKYRDLDRFLHQQMQPPLTPPRGPEGPTYLVNY